MSKNAHKQNIGLSPSFNLGESLRENTHSVGENELPRSVEAANKLAETIRIDVKTGLLNEPTWRENLAIKIGVLGEGDSLRVWLCDVDGFKLVNDKLGHLAGDELLGIIAEGLRHTFRRGTDSITIGSDEVTDSGHGLARLHGDEFAISSVVQAGEDEHRLLSDSEALRHQSEELNRNIQGFMQDTIFSPFGVSVSLGTAQYREGDSVEELLERADQSMYAAKAKE